MVTRPTSLTANERRDPPQETVGQATMWQRRAVFLSLWLVAIVFVIDISLPLGVASAVFYMFAVLLALQSSQRALPGWIALLCGLLTVTKLFLFPDRGSTELWKVLVNRFVAVFAIGMTAFLGSRKKRFEEEKREAEAKTRLHLAELAHMGRLKTAGQLAATLAHELNQPLAAISLQGEVARALVAEAAINKEELVAALREINDQTHRAADILRTLRGLVHKAEPHRELVAIHDIVCDAARLADSAIRQADVVLYLDLCKESLIVLGDRTQLELVLLNLLQNAVESFGAGSDPRTVRVQSRREGNDRLLVSVHDDGKGLAPEDVERVFEHFFTTKPTGMGMGLAICRSIIEAHAGQLWAMPNPVRGATFTFVLPLARQT